MYPTTQKQGDWDEHPVDAVTTSYEASLSGNLRSPVEL